MKKIISKTAVYVVLTFFAVVFAAPLVYAVYYSFTLPENLGTIYPLSEFTTFFYQVLFAKYPVIQWFLNSVVVMLCVVVANVFITIMAGYALARIDFKGRNLLSRSPRGKRVSSPNQFERNCQSPNFDQFNGTVRCATFLTRAPFIRGKFKSNQRIATSFESHL